jgi:DMSO/TMAO reductase YedYZ molybdopterin-dependent catalytic subunit
MLKDESIFPRQSTVVSLQCSGTRRIEQIHEYPGDGDELINAPWGEGAIGTARWTGVSLKKVIKYCGGLKDDGGHVEFFGADTYFKKGQVYNYAVSVPVRKMKINEVLLAWEMNGEPLPAIHGFPLRVVVMGYIGARSCKWLTRINVINAPTMAPVQMKEYLYYTPQMGKQNVTYSNGFSIQTMPVSSAIMTPVNNDVIIHDGKITFTGWAFSGSGWPERVEVSNDGGGVWYEVPDENLSKKYFHAWRTWSFECPVDAEGWLEFCVRCWDDALNVSLIRQPLYSYANMNRRNPPSSAVRGIGTYTSPLPATASSSTVSTSRSLRLLSVSSSSKSAACRSCPSRALCLSISRLTRTISRRCRSAMDVTPQSNEQSQADSYELLIHLVSHFSVYRVVSI